MKKQSVFLIFFLLLFTVLSARDFEHDFQNPALSIEKRVDNLVSLLTQEEKVQQLLYNAPAIDRLGIPRYNWWNECLHGVARNGRATVFPQAIGMAATWDTDLIYRVGAAIGIEARAKYNVCSANDFREIYQGLTFWSPNVNLFRDPRWGRGHETYGEDPYLTGRIGVAFVKGLQGDHPKYLQAAGCAKHYVVHSGPEGLRHEFDAVVSQKDLWETYMPGFEALVTEAKVEGVMGAYNRTNGHPCCAHPYLMGEILRGKWGFDGYFTSDCWAIRDFFDGHNIVETAEEAVALALKEGCNLNCGNSYPHIIQAIEQGLVSEAEVDRNLKELLPTRFRLGLFDPPDMVPWSSIGPEVIACDEHVALSRKVAGTSIVLLKNQDNLLPIPKDLRKIYVTGPLATHIQGLLANYYGLHENLVTVVEGVLDKVSPQTKVTYRQGALLTRPNVNPIDWFSGEAADSDVTIACLGISQLIEGEEGESLESDFKGDRKDIALPPSQVDFLKTIREKAQKLVVVMFGGSPIAFPQVLEMADAVLFVWYPGQEGGNAIADVIFGDTVPSGRLPLTFPKSVNDLPPYEDYTMTGRTYRYADKEPLFPFGFGLSYTVFEYSDLQLSSKSVRKGESLTATFKLTNTGPKKAREVVQVYITDKKASVTVPKYSLKKFKRIALWPGESKNVKIDITPGMMEIVDKEGRRVIEKGDFTVTIGGCSPGERGTALGAPEPVKGEYTVK